MTVLLSVLLIALAWGLFGLVFLSQRDPDVDHLLTDDVLFLTAGASYSLKGSHSVPWKRSIVKLTRDELTIAHHWRYRRVPPVELTVRFVTPERLPLLSTTLFGSPLEARLVESRRRPQVAMPVLFRSGLRSASTELVVSCPRAPELLSVLHELGRERALQRS